MGQKRERDGEGAPRRGSKLDAETLAYYAEIDETLQGLEEPEERQLLADNVLGDAEGREVEVATDAACSRVLEKLLPCATTEALCKFSRACVEGDGLGTMCTSGPFGSHVLEKCLIELARRAGSAGDDEFEAIEAALTTITEACSACLYELATSKYGSFVARRLLCVLSGRDVAGQGPKKAQQQAEAAAGGAEQGQQAQQQGQQGPRGGGALAAKLGGGGGGGQQGAAASADYPALLDKVAAAVMSDDWGGEEMQRLATDAFAGPVLQALLRACTHNPKLQQRVLLRVLGGAPSKGVEGVSMDRCHALLQDRNGSHLMEAVFATAPDDYFAKLTTLCFKGHLLPLAQHATANFGVQAAIAALRKPQQLKRMFEDLKPAFQQLLRSRRSGVVAALLAAAGRLGTQEAEAAEAVWAAVGAAGGSPLVALLTLDTNTQLGAGGGRLSTLGCAMASALLRLPAGACRQWADAAGALPPSQLQHVARDPGGCRVLEAYLEGPGGAAKKRRALLQGLGGSWGEVAMGGSGSHFVEKCYALAEVAEKEAIAAELAAAEARLMTTHRGPLLLRRCHVDAYKKGADGWQARVAAADEARREFEDLFGEATAAAEAKQAEEAAAEEEEEEEEAEEEAGSGDGGKAKKAKKEGKKGKRKKAAAEEQGGGGEGAQEEQRGEGRPKKSKKGKAAAAEAAPAAADGSGKKKKKRKQLKD